MWTFVWPVRLNLITVTPAKAGVFLVARDDRPMMRFQLSLG